MMTLDSRLVDHDRAVHDDRAGTGVDDDLGDRGRARHLQVMAAIGALPGDALHGFTVLGELALDGSITSVAGVLPAAMAAVERQYGLICPEACGSEAAWASSELEILAPRSLIQLANHFKGTQVMSRPEPAIMPLSSGLPDLRDIKGQESAKRTLEIAAAGGHNLLILDT